MELAAALGLILLLVWAAGWYLTRAAHLECGATRELLRHETQRLEQRIDGFADASAGAQRTAESAKVIAEAACHNAQRADRTAREARERAEEALARPGAVLLVTPADKEKPPGRPT